MTNPMTCRKGHPVQLEADIWVCHTCGETAPNDAIGRAPAGTRPFVRNGWLFLPDTADHHPVVVKLACVVSVEVEGTGNDNKTRVRIMIDANEDVYFTDAEFFDDVVRLVETGGAS